jgi:hypothetical protein
VDSEVRQEIPFVEEAFTTRHTENAWVCLHDLFAGVQPYEMYARMFY